MGKVVKFGPKSRPDTIWICRCGSASFELRGDGSAVCCDCEERVSGEEGAWFDPLKAVSRETSDKPNYTYRGNDDGELARRRVQRNAADADWIICGNNEGKITEWAKIRLPKKDRQALKKRIDYGVKLLMDDLAK